MLRQSESLLQCNTIVLNIFYFPYNIEYVFINDSTITCNCKILKQSLIKRGMKHILRTEDNENIDFFIYQKIF